MTEPSHVEAALQEADNSAGGEVDPSIRGKVEMTTGADLREVRVHTGSASQQAAAAVQARAYTVGQDIHFGANQYQPGSPDGDRLIAHELAHTIQQGPVGTLPQGKLEISQPQDTAEVEADAVAEAAVSGAGPVSEVTPEPHQVQRAVQSPAPEQRPTISQGSQGKEVQHAQQRLNAHGAQPPLVEDGIFGPLTHKATIAYQGSHALAADGTIGTKTWESLEGPVRLGGGHGSGGGSPGPGLLYDATAFRLQPPPTGTTLAHVKADLAASQSKKPQPDLGPNLAVKGVQQGQDEEIFVHAILFDLGKHDRWGTEADLVADIGWPPRGGGSAPKGQVTVKIDSHGNAEATLLDHGKVTTVARFKTEQDARAALIADFKLLRIGEEGGGSWAPGQLNKTYVALSRLSAGERSALAGVSLIRVPKIFGEDGKERSGEFTHAEELSADKLSASRSAALRLADLAFADDDVSFIGDKGSEAPASFEVILHEAGHAVETQALRDAKFAELDAVAAFNRTLPDFNTANDRVNDQVKLHNAAVTTLNAKAGRYSAKDRKASRALESQIGATQAAIDRFGKGNVASQHADHEKTAAEAIQKRKDEQAKLRTASPTHSALVDFAPVQQVQDDWFAAAQKRAKAHTAMSAAEDKTNQKRKEEKATEGTGGHSRRLDRFVKVVKDNHIKPLTSYARDNWPGHPEEFYAEAFSLWKNDPVYLEANAKPLFDWFNNGEHLK